MFSVSFTFWFHKQNLFEMFYFVILDHSVGLNERNERLKQIFAQYFNHFLVYFVSLICISDQFKKCRFYILMRNRHFYCFHIYIFFHTVTAKQKSLKCFFQFLNSQKLFSIMSLQNFCFNFNTIAFQLCKNKNCVKYFILSQSHYLFKFK